MNEQKIKLKVVLPALRPASADGARATGGVARELARRSTESACASRVFEGGRETGTTASKDGQYGQGLNERRGATEERRGQPPGVRFGEQRLRRDGFGDEFDADGCRMRVGNEVALQAARQTARVAAAIFSRRRLAVACGDQDRARELRRVVMMRQADEQHVRHQTQEDERRKACPPAVPGCEVAVLLEMLLSLRYKIRNYFSTGSTTRVNYAPIPKCAGGRRLLEGIRRRRQPRRGAGHGRISNFS